MNFNDNPQSKLNGQIKQYSADLKGQQAKKADLGQPDIAFPGSPQPVAQPTDLGPTPPVPNDFGPAMDTSSDSNKIIAEQKKGFKAHQQDATGDGSIKERVKAQLKKELTDRASQKMGELLNPNGQPEGSAPMQQSPLAPTPPKSATPSTPPPATPSLNRVPRPSSPPAGRTFSKPAIPRPKFR